MKYRVQIVHAALNDLYAINEYYLEHVSDQVASRILKKLQNTIQSLDRSPERGAVPSELKPTGSQRYRQILSNPYRIIYRIEDKKVYVVMVVDGRRDVATALIRRQMM